MKHKLVFMLRHIMRNRAACFVNYHDVLEATAARSQVHLVPNIHVGVQSKTCPCCQAQSCLVFKGSIPLHGIIVTFLCASVYCCCAHALCTPRTHRMTNLQTGMHGAMLHLLDVGASETGQLKHRPMCFPEHPQQTSVCYAIPCVSLYS